MTDLKSHDPAGDDGLPPVPGRAGLPGQAGVHLAPPGGDGSFDEMTNLSKPLREKLKETCFITAPQVARKQVSRLDGTIKYLWELCDGNCIETVLMQYHHGNTVCISSQVGCRMGCAFCASTIAGKVRDLTPGGDAGPGAVHPDRTPACPSPTSC